MTTPAVLSQLLAGLLGYFLGSIPTAFLIVRWKSGLDIRRAGSGNVGTLNSFQVSGSRVVGIVVLFIDLLKGFGAVWVASHIIGSEFSPLAWCGVGAVLGHVFPVWLGFKGGRGLATAAGVFFYLAPLCVAAWGIGWTMAFGLTREVNFANILASLWLLGLLLFLPDSLIMEATATVASPTEFRQFGGIIITILLIGHLKPAVELFQNHRVRKKKDRSLP